MNENSVSVNLDISDIQFTGSLTIQNADDIRERLLKTLALNNHVSVDCSAAENVDTTFVQLLLAARRSVARIGGRLLLTPAADGALLAALQRGGFVTDSGGDTKDDAFWLKGGQ